MEANTVTEFDNKAPARVSLPGKCKEKLATTWAQVKLNRASYFLMAPFLAVFILFVVAPVFTAVVLSFTYYNVIEPPSFIGWSNYKQLFLDDDVFLIAVKNTFLFAIITGPVSYFACLLFAWLINELKPKARAVATLLFYAPSISGNVFFIWGYIFSGDAYGLINGWLMGIGLVKEPVLWLQDPAMNLFIIMLVQLWMSLGTSFLAFIAGLQSVDRALYEAGAIDGVKNRWQELYHITIPSMKPQLIFGAVMQITVTFAVSDICMQLAGFPSPLYSAHTIVLHMYDYGSIRYEMGYASSIAVVLFIITVGTNQFVRKFLKPD
jgi:multiple sugar transport system permease protein